MVGEGHTLEAHERVSLCRQRPSPANDSDDELEYAAKDGEDEGACRISTCLDTHMQLSLRLPTCLPACLCKVAEMSQKPWARFALRASGACGSKSRYTLLCFP